MIEVDTLGPDDRVAWAELFSAYNAFYGRAVTPPEILDRAWQEFRHGNRMNALGARLDGSLVGIAHFLVHASTTAPDVCYLQDLFTAPANTHEDNRTARRLYDQVAENRGFVQYVLPL